MATTQKTKARKKAAPQRRQLTNAELLQLARKRKPPQSWYDEGINPFKPAAKPKR